MSARCRMPSGRGAGFRQRRGLAGTDRAVGPAIRLPRCAGAWHACCGWAVSRARLARWVSAGVRSCDGSHMELRLLGSVEARVDDRPVAIGAGRSRAVLAMLALNTGSAVSAERLIDGLWGEAPPSSASKMVQGYVSQLRKTLAASGDGAEIVTRGRGYELRLGDGDVDARRFEELVASGAPREALALWRGPPLDDVATEPFAAPEIRRLEELRLSAAEQAIERDLAAGRHADVVGRARRAGRRGAAARAPPRAADAGAVPLRAAGRRARGLSAGARGARRCDRRRAGAGAAPAPRRDPPAGPVARPARHGHRAAAGWRRSSG